MLIIQTNITSNLSAQNINILEAKTKLNKVNNEYNIAYIFVISNKGSNSVKNFSFNDVFPKGVSKVTFGNCNAIGGAVCPSLKNCTLTKTHFYGVIPFLPENGQITMTIIMHAPISNDFENVITNNVNSSISIDADKVIFRKQFFNMEYSY